MTLHTDIQFAAAKRAAGTDHDWRSVPAIITYVLLGIWFLMMLGIYILIVNRLPISVVMLGLLSGVFGTHTTMVVGAVGFWVGSSVSSKVASERAAETSTEATKALAQLAGAGPPPPAEPLAAEPALAAPATAPEPPVRTAADARRDFAGRYDPEDPTGASGPGTRLGEGRPAE